MNSKQSIRIFFLMLALLMGAASETWAEVVPLSNIIIEGGTQVGETQEFTISNGSVTRKSVAEDAGGSKVTITVTPATGYYVEIENIIVQKLQDMSSAQTRNTTFPIADKLAVTQVGETNDYTFVIPTGFSGALVSVTFTAKSAATAVVTPKELTFNGEAQELVTLGTITGGEGENSVTFSFEQNGTYSSDIPIGTNAGTYTVWYKVAPDVDHSEGSGSVEVTINKAQLTSVILNKTVLNTSESVSVTSVKAGSLDVPSTDYVVSGDDATTVGSYTLTVTAQEGSNYTGSVTANYKIVAEEVIRIPDTSLGENPSMTAHYILTADVSASALANLYTASETTPFSGTLEGTAKDDGTFTKITGTLSQPLFKTVDGGTVKNIILESVSISQEGYVGAICCSATGTTRIYNCGILPTTAEHIATNRSTVASTNNHCGSLVGYLDDYARVINCFSYANVSAPAGNAGGLVGYNNFSTQQGNSQTNFDNNVRTMVVNCMFYGDITQGNIKRPVYGGNSIANNAEHKVNNYNYYCEEEASFDDNYSAITDYNCSWPVAKKYLTRFEIYRNILNSNRRLCTWWVSGAYNAVSTDADVESVDIAKWVLDLSIAPYPILKEWGKYPSTINQDPDKRVDPSTRQWSNRATSSNWGKHTAPDTEGQILGTVNVTISGGNHHSGSASRTINITAMDTEYKDFCYGKIQLPYYNEIFGNPNGTTWSAKYGDNYTDMVVTGWEITTVSGGTPGTFDGSSSNAWESGYNFADRKCTDKDKYSVSGRVFAQGGYYYVPDGVTAITITAHWGNAVYLRNTNNRLDRVNNATNDFYIAGELKFGGNTGVLPKWPSGNTLKNSLSSAVTALKTVSEIPTVYDQAIVLVSNYQNNAFHNDVQVKGSEYNSKAKPFTIMSADFDFDNEPDFCFQAGMNNGGRPYFQPIRFDFLMVPDITMAIRKNADYLGMRIICPQGHFEVTETSYMYITQFEYDKRSGDAYAKHEAPIILNGGEFFQLVSSELGNVEITDKPTTLTNWTGDRTSYFLLGGNLWMKAFTPGVHGNSRASTRHCAVNAIGGEFPEFYLSGMFRTDFYNKTDNPHAYLDGGKFGIVAGAGMESVGGKNETNGGDVTFKINHSLIDEFYGGGINAQRPVTGNISVTIDNSKVTKYCGGPKLGDMSNTKTITTNATGTTFDEFYGGGNGGTNLLRERKSDAGSGTDAPTKDDHSKWDRASTGNGQDANYGGYFTAFTPFGYDANKGYQAEYEFEMLPRTSGNSKVITRSYYYWASFSKTKVAPITNTITDCTFNGDFYGGGNLGAVDSPKNSTDPAISSTLKGHTVVHGSAFGAGYSASATSFKVHDKSTVVYPYRDNAGFIHDGSLDYGPTEYTWIHDIPAAWGKTASTGSPTFDYDGNYYCYTDTELTGLGTVTGDVSLTIEGNTVVMGKVVNVTEDANGNKVITYGAQTGGVFGGGDASEVVGNTIVKIDASGQQTIDGYDYNTYNVFGGGNKATVTGNSKVTLKNKSVISSNVFGGGNEAPVTGSSEVNIEE